MASSPRLGLRAQIVLALSLVFLLAVWSLGFVTLQITRRSGEVAHARSERLLGQAVGLLLERPGQPETLFRELCTSLASRAGVSGLRLLRTQGAPLQCGSSDLKGASRVTLANGDQLLVRLPVTRDASGAAFVNLLLFYLAFTGLAVLLLAYVLLTYLIVRPIERLTRSVEGFTAGMDHVIAPEEGSAEAARLARRFNDMAGQLRAKQAQLLARVRELERTTGDLRSKEQQLIHGEKLASVGRLAAGVAHEIGNPLAAILGLLELLRGGELSVAESSEFLARVQRETERIHRIIRDLLDFARRDAEDAASSETSDLRAVIDDAVNLVKPQKESKDIAIEVAVEAGANRVLGPRHRLTQIVLNLLLNAVDALDGRGRIQVRARPLGDGSRVLLQVTDDGPGIAREMQDKLFDPFTTTKPVGKGTGLGLAVTHAIVEGLGGRIEGKNREEGGACFEVQLRLPATGSSAALHQPPA